MSQIILLIITDGAAGDLSRANAVFMEGYQDGLKGEARTLLAFQDEQTVYDDGHQCGTADRETVR